MKEKTPLSHEVVCFQMLDFETSNSESEVEIKLVENYFFLKNYVTSEGAVSHNVLCCQQLTITRYQVKFYANKYFEKLPIVTTAFKVINFSRCNNQRCTFPLTGLCRVSWRAK